MRGIKKLTVYCRKIVSEKDSQLDVRAPTLSPQYDTSLSLAPGTPGPGYQDRTEWLDLKVLG